MSDGFIILILYYIDIIIKFYYYQFYYLQVFIKTLVKGYLGLSHLVTKLEALRPRFLHVIAVPPHDPAMTQFMIPNKCLEVILWCRQVFLA